MTLRLGVDLDGTLADLSALYHRYENDLFGSTSSTQIDETADSEGTAGGAEAGQRDTAQRLKAARARSGRQEEVWRALRSTPDLWTTLDPIEPGAVRALYELSQRFRWEVFFITQRPQSAGATVQTQTQQWLIANGFETPSVLTLSGSRGKAANALDLDFLIDDLPKNCVDVISDSKCRPILVLRERDTTIEAGARRMDIGIVSSVLEALDLLSNPVPAPRQTAVSAVLRLLGLSR